MHSILLILAPSPTGPTTVTPTLPEGPGKTSLSSYRNYKYKRNKYLQLMSCV